MASFGGKLKHAWNAFVDDTQQEQQPYFNYGAGSFTQVSSGSRRSFGINRQSVVTPLYNRLAIDVAAVDIQHVTVDDQERFVSKKDSGLNYCLNVEANMDQSARVFKQELAMSLFENGYAALIPTNTDLDPMTTNSYDIKTMRVAEIAQWYPQHVRLRVYDDMSGTVKEITVPKRMVAIITNPFYAVMNEENSTLKRLISKINMLDNMDERTSSGKLDLIIQLPYVVKSEARKEQAKARRNEMEDQLQNSTHGIAYTDGTEKITQLNRPVENNLGQQVKDLLAKLYSELGLTEAIFLGTADEATMLNYYNRTIEPIMTTVAEELSRKFLTKTARSQNQTIMFFRDLFKLMTVSNVAEVGDKLTRNAIVSSNEMRAYIGLKPSSDPGADELSNKNLPANAQVTGSDGTAPAIEASVPPVEDQL